MPLEFDCDLEYDNPEDVNMDEVAEWRHKCAAVLRCNKGCGTEVYFDPNNKSRSGKLIPMEVAMHENHICRRSGRYSLDKEAPILCGLG